MQRQSSITSVNSAGTMMTRKTTAGVVARRAAGVWLLSAVSAVAFVAPQAWAETPGQAYSDTYLLESQYRTGKIMLEYGQKFIEHLDELGEQHRAQQRLEASGQSIIKAGKASTRWRAQAPENSQVVPEMAAYLAKNSTLGSQDEIAVKLKNLLRLYPTLAQQWGLAPNDVADAIALFTLICYQVATVRDDAALDKYEFSSKQVAGVRQQISQSLLKNAKFQGIDEAGRCIVGEKVTLSALLLLYGRYNAITMTDASKTAEIEALRQDATKGFESVMGYKPTEALLTNAGFQAANR